MPVDSFCSKQPLQCCMLQGHLHTWRGGFDEQVISKVWGWCENFSLYYFPNIQDARCSLEVDGTLSPVGAIQSGNVHLFDIHFC